MFELFDYSYKASRDRKVFRFKMRLFDESDVPRGVLRDSAPTRMIPSWVKQAVYKRDKGRCVLCGSGDHLHFDHDLPYSRGGASVLLENVRLLCARHNLEKGAKIQ